MTPRRQNPPPVDPATGRNNGGRFVRPSAPIYGNAAIDWPAFLRRIERKRRLLRRLDGAAPSLPLDYYARATYVSFRLDAHHDLREQDVRAALGLDDLSTDRSPLQLRSRLSQRLRNHAAILHHIESALRNNRPLTPGDVIRWYTTVSAGLSTNALNPAAATRLDDLIRRLNAPHPRVQGALHEVAATHVRLLTDPLVPSFNGILARLLLRYHLGRCHLPPVLFHPDTPAAALAVPKLLLPLLMEQLDHSFELLQAGSK